MVFDHSIDNISGNAGSISSSLEAYGIHQESRRYNRPVRLGDELILLANKRAAVGSGVHFDNQEKSRHNLIWFTYSVHSNKVLYKSPRITRYYMGKSQ